MKASKGIRKLIDDAQAKGLFVRETGSDCIIKGRFERGLVIFPDGTALRTDVDPRVATTIRTQRLMRAFLGLDA